MREVVPINYSQTLVAWYFIKNSYVKYNVFFGKVTPDYFNRQFKRLTKEQTICLTSFYKQN